jgi:ATP-binding cassette, subfamily B, bacterial PglK
MSSNIKYYSKIYKIIPDTSKKKLGNLIFLFLSSAVLEIAGIALIIPIIFLIADKSFLVSKIPYHFVSEDYFPIMLLLSIISLYILKNISLIWILKKKAKLIFLIGDQLSSQIYKILLFKNYEFFRSKDTSKFIRNLVQDVNIFIINIILPIISISIELILILFASLILFITEPLFFFIILSVGLLAGILYFKFFQKKLSIIGKEILEASTKRIKLSRQGFDGIKDIIINQNQNKFINLFLFHTGKFYDANHKKYIASALPRFFIEIIFVFAFGIFILLMIVRGDELKDIFLIMGIYAAVTFRLMPTFIRVYAELTNLKISLPVINDLEKIILLEDEKYKINKRENEKDLSNIKFKNQITFEDIEFSYPDNNQKIFKNLNFKIKRGEKIGIIGESGSGKTTFVDLLTGLIDPVRGQIKIDGLNLLNIKFNWFNLIGYMSQKSFIIDGTIRENILFGNNESSDEEIKKILQLVQFNDFNKNSKFNLDNLVDENGANFSGGQLQRLVLARTLIKKPEIVILDECTSALDKNNESKILNNLINADFLKTLIIISHRKEILNFCDRILKVSNGNLEKE